MRSFFSTKATHLRRLSQSASMAQKGTNKAGIVEKVYAPAEKTGINT